MLVHGGPRLDDDDADVEVLGHLHHQAGGEEEEDLTSALLLVLSALVSS